MDKMLPAFLDSLFTNFSDLCVDWLEDSLDSLTNNEVLKNIPIIKTTLGFCKVGICIRERNFMRQTLSFLSGFQNGSLTQKQIDAYRQKNFKDKKRTMQELERVLVVLDQQIDTRHPTLRDSSIEHILTRK